MPERAQSAADWRPPPSANRFAKLGARKVVAHNLCRSGFAGPVLPVTPTHSSVDGVLAYPDLERLPLTLELGVICTPQATIAGQIAALARKGTKAAVVITAGLGELRQAMLDAARPNLTRILGPNCLGLMAPGLTLNASFAHIAPLPGNVAFVRNPARWRPRC